MKGVAQNNITPKSAQMIVIETSFKHFLFTFFIFYSLTKYLLNAFRLA